MADVNLAIEAAFQACQTEEQAILADANAAGVQVVQTNQAIASYKLSLKQSIRKTVAAAEKAAAQSASQLQAVPDASNDIPPPRGLRCAGSTRRYDGAIIWMNCR